MTVTAQLVQTLHRINCQKADLNNQLQRCPKLIAAAELKLKAAEDEAKATKDKLTKAKVDSHSMQLQMNEREQKIHKLNGKLNAAKENREYQALKDQIAADTQANAVLSDEILDLLEQIDLLGKKLAMAEAEVQAKRGELTKVQHQVADRQRVLESELERVQTELDATEIQLTGDLKRDYLRMVGSKGADALAEMDGKCCGGCYQSLTPSLLDRLLMSQTIICPNCGRLVYQNHQR
jgi:uncharacterized protein